MKKIKNTLFISLGFVIIMVATFIVPIIVFSVAVTTVMTAFELDTYLSHKLHYCIEIQEFNNAFDNNKYLLLDKFRGEATCDKAGVLDVILDDGTRLTRKPEFVPRGIPINDSTEEELFISKEDKKYIISYIGDNYYTNCAISRRYNLPDFSLLSQRTIVVVKVLASLFLLLSLIHFLLSIFKERDSNFPIVLVPLVFVSIGIILLSFVLLPSGLALLLLALIVLFEYGLAQIAVVLKLAGNRLDRRLKKT